MARHSVKRKRRPEFPAPKPGAGHGAAGVSTRSRVPAALQALALVLAGLWIYGPALHGDWLWDDVEVVAGNTQLRTLDGLGKIWLVAPLPDWPLTSTLLWMAWHLFGNQPLGYHLCSLALHLLSAFLIWRLLGRLGLRWGWLGGFLFVLHPLTVESVAWVSEIKNTLSLPFFLLALDAWLDAEERQPGAYARSVLFYLGAMWSKTSTVGLPLVLLLYGWWKRGTVTREEIKRLVPYVAIALVLGLVTVHFQSNKLADASIKLGSFPTRLVQAGAAVFFYLGRFISPVGFLPIYPRPSFDPPSWPQLLALPLLLVLLAGIWTQRQTWGRAVLFGLGFFLIGLLPALGLVKMEFMSISWVSDHFAYLPMVGLIGLVVAGFESASGAVSASVRPVILATVIVACALLAWIAHAEAALFVNEDTLWAYTLQHNPQSAVAHNNWGTGLMRQGRVMEAADQFKQALRIDPGNPNAHLNLGTILLKSGRLPEAESQFEQALQLNPDYANAHNGLGIVFMQTGRFAEAIAQYQAALKISPDFANAHHNLATVLLHLGRVPEGIAEEELALQANPVFAEAHAGLGDAFAQTGRVPEAIEQYEQALKGNPNSIQARRGLAQAEAGLAPGAAKN